MAPQVEVGLGFQALGGAEGRVGDLEGIRLVGTEQGNGFGASRVRIVGCRSCSPLYRDLLIKCYAMKNRL